MQRIGGNGNSVGSSRPRKEKRLTFVINNGANNSKHCSSINCLSVLKSSLFSNGIDYLFTGSRDGTVKRWALPEEESSHCSATFESHVDWVNDVVIVGDKTLISCSSDATLKTWDCFGDGSCSSTLRQHSDYVTCLATAEQNSHCVASGGLGGEIFMWDFEASSTPLAKVEYDYSPKDEHSPSTANSCSISTRNNITGNSDEIHDYIPISTQGYKKSVYALAMNGSGTLLVSGGTDQVVRVWDPRAGSKAMKLRGHTENIRAILLDSTGRFCLSGSSDSMIRLWDLGQQRCVHSYAVHTDSVWALASTPTFSHVYSGGRDMSLYLTDLTNRESLLLCTKESPIQQLAIDEDEIWIATTDSSVEKWHAEVSNPKKLFKNGGSFLTRSFSRAKVSLDGSTPGPVYKEPICTILGVPAIVEYEVLNTKRHVLTKQKWTENQISTKMKLQTVKINNLNFRHHYLTNGKPQDTAGLVKLWEITRGVVVEDYGKVSFEEKKEELDMTVTVPAWFTVDARLGCLSINLDMPQCFSAETRVVDQNILENADEDKVNLGQETLKGLLVHWLTRRMRRLESEASTNISSTAVCDTRLEENYDGEDEIVVHPLFNFSKAYISIITQGSKGGPWRKNITDLDGNEDEKDFPWWCLDCVLNNRIPSKENNNGLDIKRREDSSVQIRAQGKSSTPRMSKFHKQQSEFGDGPFGLGPKSREPCFNILVQIMSYYYLLFKRNNIANLQACIWKKVEDSILYYRIL